MSEPGQDEYRLEDFEELADDLAQDDADAFRELANAFKTREMVDTTYLEHPSERTGTDDRGYPKYTVDKTTAHSLTIELEELTRPLRRDIGAIAEHTGLTVQFHDNDPPCTQVVLRNASS